MYELAKIVNILKEKKVIFYICFNSNCDHLLIDLDWIFYQGISTVVFKITDYSDEKFLEENSEIISLIKEFPIKNAESNIVKYNEVIKQMKDYKIDKNTRNDVIKCLFILKSLGLSK